jgi:hypothetical protein
VEVVRIVQSDYTSTEVARVTVLPPKSYLEQMKQAGGAESDVRSKLANIRPSLPRFDGMALNNVHYTVEVEGSAHMSAVTGKLNEQLVRPARQTERVLPPARQQGLRTPQRFGVRQLGAKSAG